MWVLWRPTGKILSLIFLLLEDDLSAFSKENLNHHNSIGGSKVAGFNAFLIFRWLLGKIASRRLKVQPVGSTSKHRQKLHVIPYLLTHHKNFNFFLVYVFLKMGRLEFQVWSVNLSYINALTVVVLKMWVCTRSFKYKCGNTAILLRTLSRRHSHSTWCLSLTSRVCMQYPPPAVLPASTSQKHTAAEGKQFPVVLG